MEKRLETLESLELRVKENTQDLGRYGIQEDS